MDYRSIVSEELPMGLPEQEFRKELEIRRAAHNLKASAAFCLRAQTIQRMAGLPPETFFEFLTQMQSESADPQAFARRILVEQVVLAKAAVEDLMISSSLSEQSEVKKENLSAAARLMAQIRKNLELLGQLPVSSEPVKEPGRIVVSDDELLDRLGYESRDANASEQEKKRVSELVNKVASSESEESKTSRGRAKESCQTPGAHRCGPPGFAGSSYAQSAVGTIQRTENGRGQAKVSSKRAARKDSVAEVDQAAIERRIDAAKNDDTLERMLAELKAKPCMIG